MLHFDLIHTLDRVIMGSIGRLFVRCIFLITPLCIWLALYRYVFRAVEYSVPGCRNTSSARSLPLGFCVKRRRRGSAENEANTPRLVEKHTDAPPPKLVDFATYEGAGFLLMTPVPGERLNKVFYPMAHEERKELGKTLGKYIPQGQTISNDPNDQITNTTGKQIYDHRFEGGRCDTFASESSLTS